MTDKILNNGKIAKFIKKDDFSRSLFEIPFKSDSLRKNSFTAIEVDGLLYTITDDEEPHHMILPEIQFEGVTKEQVYCENGDAK